VREDIGAKDRLIVALDVPAIDEAATLVGRLDNVSFFKIGWQLFISAITDPAFGRLLPALNAGGRRLFVDLKIPGDIQNTIASMVGNLCGTNVELLTLNEHMPPATIRAARAARGDADSPKLLMVPYLSSLDGEQDLRAIYGTDDFDSFLIGRAKGALDAGCDGLIASGQAIGLLRRTFPDILIVSPGIRPAGSATDDHKRSTTPAEAMRLGSDYLVVGRPIVRDPDPRAAAARIIGEIEEGLDSAASARARSSSAR
jgi:orotidine-5'-phosphate decarboxylase